jgi:hypothetical protein
MLSFKRFQVQHEMPELQRWDSRGQPVLRRVWRAGVDRLSVLRSANPARGEVLREMRQDAPGS